ncbi:MAG: methyltransferase type 11 [Mucilaginibacter sp.]|nr:methyltransferase type 11 [Mucilaginibacter sp.]
MHHVYKSIIPLVKLKSSLDDYKRFHDEVNKTFHNVEAAYYDVIHKEMWEDLPVQMNLLIGDLLGNKVVSSPGQLSLLDLGCGTGLATHLLLKTQLGARIKDITLLDTSPVMLSLAFERSKEWGRSTVIKEGEIPDIDKKFDLIIISSVLHHIPDLSSFLSSVTEKLNTGGILLTMHDPFQEAIANDIYRARCRDYRDIATRKNRNIINRFYQRIKRNMWPSERPDYISEVNSILLANKVIHTRLTEVEMWSITDIHVEGLPYASQAGISLQWLEQQLSLFILISYRSYAFFGLMEHQLNRAYRAKERELVLSGDKHGRNFGSIWVKNI